MVYWAGSDDPGGGARHLVGGSSVGEVPGGAGTIQVVARSPGAADDVWRRSREVMAAILDHPGSSWPSVERRGRENQAAWRAAATRCVWGFGGDP
jgi:hypothetical protein